MTYQQTVQKRSPQCCLRRGKTEIFESVVGTAVGVALLGLCGVGPSMCTCTGGRPPTAEVLQGY
eukprot:1536172-Amphidinium_carterae.2